MQCVLEWLRDMSGGANEVVKINRKLSSWLVVPLSKLDDPFSWDTLLILWTKFLFSLTLACGVTFFSANEV